MEMYWTDVEGVISMGDSLYATEMGDSGRQIVDWTNATRRKTMKTENRNWDDGRG